ncbi:MAG: metallophosphoesterase [Magnetococcales bacterium]|nr:metallophosphoesterase [Magnetococcales bacterium]
MTTSKKNTRYGLALVALIGAGLALPDDAWSKEKGGASTLMGYVILGEKGHALKGEIVPVVRLVLEHAQGFSDGSCANLTLNKDSGPSLSLVTRPNPNVKEMPITLCEAAFPFATKHQPQGETWNVTDKGGKQYKVQLPTVGQSPDKALILGDTGCRGTKAQTCASDWPFPTAIAQQMSDFLKKQDKPSVIIHVGDFKYRGKTDDTGKSLKWDNWKADLFTPMFGGKDGPNLLAMAPWVVTRGNHELCKTMGNNGDGWFYLLDPTSPVAGDSQQQIKDNSCQGVADGMTRPYRLDFANGLTLVVTDTAGLFEGKDVCQADKQTLVNGYKEMAQNFKGSKQSAWLVSHKPIWSVLGGCGKPSFGNATPQAALEALDHHALPENFKLSLAGHKHLYTSLDINPKEDHRRMLELVAGNGGVELNTKAYSGCLKYDESKESKSFQADASGMSRFGFVVANLDAPKKDGLIEGWKLKSMALEQTKAPWGDLKTAEVCDFPVKLGKPACEIKEKSFFGKACDSCDSVKGPNKPAQNCQSDGDDG